MQVTFDVLFRKTFNLIEKSWVENMSWLQLYHYQALESKINLKTSNKLLLNWKLSCSFSLGSSMLKNTYFSPIHKKTQGTSLTKKRKLYLSVFRHFFVEFFLLDPVVQTVMYKVVRRLAPENFGAEPTVESSVYVGFDCTTISGKLCRYISECWCEFLFSPNVLDIGQSYM